MVFDPQTGQYDYIDDKEEAFAKIVEYAINHYIIHSNGSYFKEVYVDEHGHYFLNDAGDNGTEIPQEYLDQAMQKFKNEN